jgi:hypothetical protein
VTGVLRTAPLLLAAGAALAMAAPQAPQKAAAAATTSAPSVSGTVYADANRNGKRDAGEAGLAAMAVSNQRDVAMTGPDGRYTLPAPTGGRVLFVSVPDGWSPAGSFWRPAGDASSGIDFGLVKRSIPTSFTFLHASDTHLDAASLPHLDRLRALIAEKKPDFVILTGDLVRDSLRVGEDKARPLFEMVAAELKKIEVPVFTVPGNHDIFGIERNLSKVSADHPLYGRAMYRKFLGPDYYSFTWGGLHFLGLNSVDADDMSYYGHIDKDQLDWVGRDIAAADAPVVTFNHIPLATSIEGLLGLMEDSPAPSVIQIGGHGQFRHIVSNLSELLQAMGSHRLEMALGGHMHVSERLVLDTSVGRVRFHQTAAVVGPQEAGGMTYPSGATLYRVVDGSVDDGTFLPLH